MKVLITFLLIVASWVVVRPPARRRLRKIFRSPDVEPKPRLPMRLIAASLTAFGVMMIVTSSIGVLLGIATGVVAYRFLGNLESRTERERARAIVSQMPMVCDLLAATLASGASITSAVLAVSEAVGPPASRTLMGVERAIQLGTPASLAWSAAEAEPAFDRIALAFRRSHESGAPIAELLTGVASDERREKRRVIEVAARGAGVRAVMPLAACYLPAFILLGVVPVVASMATSMFGN